MQRLGKKECMMPRTPDTEFLLKKLGELGGSAGNKALRECLGWEEEKYFRIRQRLIEEGLVDIGRGKGGSVYLLGDGSEDTNTPTDATGNAEVETDHYPRVVEKLQKQLSQDFNNVVIETTAFQGGKTTGGKWSRPDILAITLQKFEYVAADEFILRSYEIKRSDTVDTDAVAEAAAHKRAAQLSYLLIVPNGDDMSIFEPTNNKRRSIERECLKSGVGLVLISDYADEVGIELAIDATNSNIDSRDVNSAIGRFFSEQKRDEIRKLISRSRMGILQKIAEKIAEIET
jgi:hypothetical protein